MHRNFFLLMALLVTPFQIHLPKEVIHLNPGEQKTVDVEIEIPPNYFIYKDKTDLTFINAQGIKVQKIAYPESRERMDPFFKKTIHVFEMSAPISVTFLAPAAMDRGAKTLEALLQFQGCSQNLCYPLESHLISFQVDVGASVVSPIVGREQVFSWKKLLETQNFNEIWNQSWWVVVLVVMLGGFLTSLTPCVLPLIPITLLIIGVRAESPLRRNFFLSTALVLGLSLVYALLGVLAVGLGKSFGFLFQEKWFVIFLALLFFVLSLSMFGLFEIHLPKALRHRLINIKGHGLLGAFASGAVSGVLAAPCAGPVIGALLIFVATTQNFIQGFFLLFLYGLGMGILFIVLGTGYGTLEGRFRGGVFTIWMKRFLGLLLLLGSIFYLNTIRPTAISPSPVGWIASEDQGLQVAAKENRVMLIDFYADWCPPCQELEIGFFRKPEVVELLQKMVPVRIDATFNRPETQVVIKKYGVIGWPTIQFISPQGEILKDLTVVSYNPDLLLKNMQEALRRFP